MPIRRTTATARVRTGHVCRTHENGVPVNFRQCEKPIGAGVLLKRQGATPLPSPPKRVIGRGFDMKLVSLIALLLATSPVTAQTPGTSPSQTCTQDPTYCSDTGASPSTDDGQWNEQFSVERRFRWRQFARRQFGRRSRRPAIDPQRPMRRRFPHRCLGWLQLNSRPTLVRCVNPGPGPQPYRIGGHHYRSA